MKANALHWLMDERVREILGAYFDLEMIQLEK